MAKKFLFILFIVSSFGFSKSKNTRFPEWMLGHWVNKSDLVKLHETWTKVDAKKYQGISYSITNSDTTIFEKMEIVLISDSMFFIATVINENNNLPVRFYCTKNTESTIEFKNPEHDFPTKIKYTLLKKDLLVAVVSGANKSIYKEITLPMQKD